MPACVLFPGSEPGGLEAIASEWGGGGGERRGLLYRLAGPAKAAARGLVLDQTGILINVVAGHLD